MSLVFVVADVQAITEVISSEVWECAPADNPVCSEEGGGNGRQQRRPLQLPSSGKWAFHFAIIYAAITGTDHPAMIVSRSSDDIY